MKVLSWVVVTTVLVLISFPGASDAFSRRTSEPEISQITTNAGHESRANSSQRTSSDLSAQAVPEPPVLWLVSLGIGLFAIGVMLKRPAERSLAQNEQSGGHGL